MLSLSAASFSRPPNSNASLIAIFGDSVFIGSNGLGGILRYTDAITWKEVFQAEHHLESIAFDRVASGESS